MEGIQVSVEKVGPQSDVSIIRVGGYIDTTTSSELERALDSLLKAGVFRVIIDLGNVDYISSAGWGIFISEIKGIRERGGDLKLARMIPDVYEVFELLEFHYILKAFDSIEEGIRDFDVEQGVVSLEEEMNGEAAAAEEQKETDVPPAEEPTESEDDVDVKIKEIALENPTWSAAKITKELNSEAYGFTKIGSATVRKILKKMNLISKKQRESEVQESEE